MKLLPKDYWGDERLSHLPGDLMQAASVKALLATPALCNPPHITMKRGWLGQERHSQHCELRLRAEARAQELRALTVLNSSAACSRRPTRPLSVKYRPEHTPSSSGDRVSSETADSSSTLEEIF